MPCAVKLRDASCHVAQILVRCIDYLEDAVLHIAFKLAGNELQIAFRILPHWNCVGGVSHKPALCWFDLSVQSSCLGLACCTKIIVDHQIPDPRDKT